MGKYSGHYPCKGNGGSSDSGSNGGKGSGSDD